MNIGIVSIGSWIRVVRLQVAVVVITVGGLGVKLAVNVPETWDETLLFPIID